MELGLPVRQFHFDLKAAVIEGRRRFTNAALREQLFFLLVSPNEQRRSS
jgi:hypothetical protein